MLIEVPPRLTPAPAGTVPACLGQSELWESTEPMKIALAAARCRTCPVLDWCAREARHATDAGMELGGVWHGVHYGAA